jgi:hypothetical protein
VPQASSTTACVGEGKREVSDVEDQSARSKGHVGQIEANANEARRYVESVRRQLAEAEQSAAFWDDLLTHLSAGNASNVLLVLRREPERVRSLPQTTDSAGRALEEIRADAEARARAVASTFGRDFPAAVREAGLQIDSTSRHPRYTLKQGFIHVEVDDQQLTAKVSPRDGADVLMGIDVGPLVRTLEHEIGRIFDRNLDTDTFLRRLRTAYTAALRAERRPEGEEVPLRRVMNRMAKNLNRFAGDEFNVDLAQVIKAGKTTIDGLRIHLNHTRNARLGVLLYGFESGGYVGFISFKKET